MSARRTRSFVVEGISDRFGWALADGRTIIVRRSEAQRCPMCGVVAVVALPACLVVEQPDATTQVCHPAFGGCNHGFEVKKGA